VENLCFFDRFGARGFATNYPDVAAVSGDFLSVVAMLKTTTIPLHYRLMHAMVQPALETEMSFRCRRAPRLSLTTIKSCDWT